MEDDELVLFESGVGQHGAAAFEEGNWTRNTYFTLTRQFNLSLLSLLRTHAMLLYHDEKPREMNKNKSGFRIYQEN